MTPPGLVTTPLSDAAVCAAACTLLRPLSTERLARLVRAGPPDGVWAALLDGRLERWPRLGHLVSRSTRPADLLASARHVDLDQLRGQLEAARVGVVWWGGAGYPAALEADPERPAVLFTKGDLGTLDGQIVAIVGTRAATAGGRSFATALGRGLTEAGVHVLSGLARGIDGAVHRGALAVEGSAAGPIGVVASGLDHVYPPEHGELWEDVARRGLLLSEVAPGTPPSAERFPARNRILAALADVVVVVESRRRGGSLITARLATDRGVPVMAVPGSVNSPASEGTNRLIVDGAGPVLDVGDVLVALGLARPASPDRRRERRPPPEPDDRTLLTLLGADALTLDSMTLRSGRPLEEVALSLGRLEAGGWVVRSGSWFERVTEESP
jgi:DNA processing protein